MLFFFGFKTRRVIVCNWKRLDVPGGLEQVVKRVANSGGHFFQELPDPHTFVPTSFYQHLYLHARAAGRALVEARQNLIQCAQVVPAVT